MKFLIKLAVIFYVTAFIFIGCILVLFVLHVIPLTDVIQGLRLVYFDREARLIFGGVALGILLLNYIFFKAIAGDNLRRKTIAFDNPSGRVSVSLAALEDLVKRVIARVPEVKDVRSFITVSKKKLVVRARLILRAEVNIPEMTSNLQEMIKGKIQDTIGIEETVEVHIHVVKMIPVPNKTSKNKEKAPGQPEDVEPPVPFRGYRA